MTVESTLFCGNHHHSEDELLFSFLFGAVSSFIISFSCCNKAESSIQAAFLSLPFAFVTISTMTYRDKGEMTQQRTKAVQARNVEAHARQRSCLIAIVQSRAAETLR